MKVILVFPPKWTPAMPHLALPVLTACLRAHRVQVIQRDLNLETFDAALSRDCLGEAIDRLCAEFTPRRRSDRL
jgi:anaerobic magnesium-protoporphyrin IX monomethyl ester cyclase